MKSNLITRIFRRIIFPRMKGEFLQSINNSNPSVLDVGCGNDSPSIILQDKFASIKTPPQYYIRNKIGFLQKKLKIFQFFYFI
mgnify:CR=1 FL=1